mgnify:CR=1 FL=1
MSIAKAGDQVILPRPHYFNHDMWMRMQGVEPVSLDQGERLTSPTAVPATPGRVAAQRSRAS